MYGKIISEWNGKSLMQKVIHSNVEILDQLSGFIEGLDESVYVKVSKPLFESSIGQHLRHILDIFQALMKETNPTFVDYDLRRRGIPLETDPQAGLDELEEVTQWLKSLDPSTFDQPLQISTEVSLSSEETAKLNSSLGRELCFASSHLTHHLALMVVHAKLLGMEIDSKLGVAPSTATFMREQEQISCAH